MKRLLAILIVAVLSVGSLPLPGQTRLVCRMTGVEMKPVAVQESPKSCCAIREKSSGGVELANRSCCTLKTTPRHSPLPVAPLAPCAFPFATLPTVALAVPVSAQTEISLPSTPVSAAPSRGPPLTSASPRGPPTLS